MKSEQVIVLGVVLALLLVFVLMILPGRRRSGNHGGHGWWPHRGSSMYGPGGTRRLYNAEGFLDAGSPTFTMVGVDWCGHCKTAKPEFMKLGSTKTIGGQNVAVRFVNGDDKEAAAPYQVEGYPAFFLEKPGQGQIKYSGGRTESDFVAWLTQQLA